MSYDPTEVPRRLLQATVNAQMSEREILEKEYGQVWDTQEVQKDFEIVGFMAPFVVAIRKSDEVKGVLMFQDRPRYYFDFKVA